MMLPVKTIMEHEHNLNRMSSSLRSIAYDLHYCPGSKNYRRQNKMTFSPELYIQLSKCEWFTFFIYLIFTYIRNVQKTENNDFGISYYFKYMFYVSTLSLFVIKSALKLINAAQAITMSGNYTFYVHINTCNSSSCCYILRVN